MALQIIDVALQVTGALKCAHAAGFVHRDVMPSNIMLAGHELPFCIKLIDFDLVHATAGEGSEEGLTADGGFLGTPLFASAEQLNERTVDGQSDLFSLGMTLWYLAEGAPPLVVSATMIAAERLNSESYAAKLPSSLPKSLQLVLARFLEKDPGARIASAGEAMVALKECAESLGMKTPEVAEISTSEIAGLAGESEVLAEIVPQANPIVSKYKLLSRVADSNTGAFYISELLVSPERAPLLHVLHPDLVDNHLFFRGCA